MTGREPSQAGSPPAKAPRLASLDVFRGATIAAMVLVNMQPEPKYWPLEHAEWHGWTPTDLIFPFFLFIMGVATPFSLGKRAASGKPQNPSRPHLGPRNLPLRPRRTAHRPALHQLLARPAAMSGSKPFASRWRVLCVLGVLLLLIPWRSSALALAAADRFRPLLRRRRSPATSSSSTPAACPTISPGATACSIRRTCASPACSSASASATASPPPSASSSAGAWC